MNIQVLKSNWNLEKFDINKIRQWIIKAFKVVWEVPSNIEQIISEILDNINQEVDNWKISTKIIGDIVEKILMKNWYYDVAKAFISYRTQRQSQKQEEKEIFVVKRNWNKEKFDINKVKKLFKKLAFDLPECKRENFYKEFKKYIIPNIQTSKILDIATKACVDNISTQNIKWHILAWRFILADLYKQACINRKINLDQIYTPESYLALFKDYINQGLYYEKFFNFYTEDDILQSAKWIDKDRDYSYGYTTMNMYRKRYLLNPNKIVKELPQEMYLSVALFLAIPEGLDIVRKFKNGDLDWLNLSEEDKKQLVDIVSKLTEDDIKILNKQDRHLDDIEKISKKVLLHPWLRKKRLDFAKKVYEFTSSWKISLPTPTLLNARTNFHQLSSCFKLNVDDDLRGIYHTIENMAQISKFGWWIWSYLGHIRSKWAPIRGRRGASGWVIPWIKVMNDTAIAVNQLWARAGAISVTIDIWHKDIRDFLELQTERWDIRQKAYDVFPAVSIPDLFMKRMIEGKEWTLFDPYEVRHFLAKKFFKDYSKEWGFVVKKLSNVSFDYKLIFDNEQKSEEFVKKFKDNFLDIVRFWKEVLVKVKGLEDWWGEDFEKLYQRLEDQPLKLKEKVNAKELFKQFLMTVVETGMPYVFFRDTANRFNPNNHCWMVYSTQLCTEIIQNTKQPRFVEEVLEDGKVAIKYIPGDLVTCNLASINVAKVWKDQDIAEVIPVAMRILDNVIDLNFYPVKESFLTAKKYRPVWLWFMWLAEHLATQAKLRYDSKEAVEYVDKLFEKYGFWTIKASVELAKERWTYPLFKWSKWSQWILWWKDKKWFYENTEHWEFRDQLIEEVKKYWVRFGYHQAPAPNTSTSLVVWTTAGVLPVYKKYFVETNSKWTNVNIAPNLWPENFWLYKEYIHMKMDEVIDMIAVIQKWIDQSISFEWLFNPMETSPVDLYNRYIKAWKKWIKTIYYVRSMSLEVEKCESCAG